MVRDLHRFTPHTITDTARIEAELAQIRATGLARQCGELREDRGCLAVGIRDQVTGHLVAGLAMVGPPARVSEPNTDLGEMLREHAHRLAPLLA